MYEFLFNNLQFPVAPEKLKIKINNQNETMSLISGEAINIPRAPGLMEISFEVLLPSVQYPFAVYPDGYHSPDYYLHALYDLKEQKRAFTFAVNRRGPQGILSYDFNLSVLLEEYTITEEAEEGCDVKVDIRLKQFNSYSSILVDMVENIASGEPAIVMQAKRESKEPAKSYTVKAGDTLWDICRRELGDGSRWKEIAKLNELPNPNLIMPGQVIRLA